MTLSNKPRQKSTRVGYLVSQFRGKYHETTVQSLVRHMGFKDAVEILESCSKSDNTMTDPMLGSGTNESLCVQPSKLQVYKSAVNARNYVHSKYQLHPGAANFLIDCEDHISKFLRTSAQMVNVYEKMQHDDTVDKKQRMTHVALYCMRLCYYMDKISYFPECNEIIRRFNESIQAGLVKLYLQGDLVKAVAPSVQYIYAVWMMLASAREDVIGKRKLKHIDMLFSVDVTKWCNESTS